MTKTKKAPAVEKIKTTVELPVELHKRARILGIELGTDLRALIVEGLEMRLAAEKKGRS